MRLSKLVSGAVALGAVAAVAVAPSAAVAEPASAAATSGSKCTTVSFIEELITTETRETAPEGPSIGDVVITLDGVLNEDREQIGTNDIIGAIIRQDQSTGELFSFSTSKYEFDNGGVIRVAGTVNLTALAAGKTQELPAFGTGGKYAGKNGKLTWTLVSGLESHNSIRLCG